MAGKPPETGAGSFDAAAEKCGVSVGELKMWIAEHTKFTGDRWSKWNSGAEPIPGDLLLEFMRAKVEEMRRAQAG